MKPKRKLKDISVLEISLLFGGRPAVPQATVLMAKSEDAELQKKLIEVYKELGKLKGQIEVREMVRQRELVAKGGRDLPAVVAELCAEISKLLDRPVRTHNDVMLGAPVIVSKADCVVRIAQLRKEFDSLWREHLQGN